jgi:TetR/AcrR family transcriptional regulator, transcriptional repressor for nem operon
MAHGSELLSAAARLAAIAAISPSQPCSWASPRRPRISGLDKTKTTGHIERMPRVSVREEIVESALVEFHRRGFSACSVEDITRAAGVPKGSFYNHFKSKEDLGAEVVRRYSAASGWRAELPAGLTPLEELRARFSVMRDVLTQREFSRGCLVGNMGTELADHSQAIRGEVAASLDAWSARTVDLLRAAQAAGQISVGLDADRLGRFLVNAWEGAVTRTKVIKGPEAMDDFFAVVFDQLLR